MMKPGETYNYGLNNQFKLKISRLSIPNSLLHKFSGNSYITQDNERIDKNSIKFTSQEINTILDNLHHTQVLPFLLYIV